MKKLIGLIFSLLMFLICFRGIADSILIAENGESVPVGCRMRVNNESENNFKYYGRFVGYVEGLPVVSIEGISDRLYIARILTNNECIIREKADFIILDQAVDKDIHSVAYVPTSSDKEGGYLISDHNGRNVYFYQFYQNDSYRKNIGTLKFVGKDTITESDNILKWIDCTDLRNFGCPDKKLILTLWFFNKNDLKNTDNNYSDWKQPLATRVYVCKIGENFNGVLYVISSFSIPGADVGGYWNDTYPDWSGAASGIMSGPNWGTGELVQYFAYKQLVTEFSRKGRYHVDSMGWKIGRLKVVPGDGVFCNAELLDADDTPEWYWNDTSYPIEDIKRMAQELFNDHIAVPCIGKEEKSDEMVFTPPLNYDKRRYDSFKYSKTIGLYKELDANSINSKINWKWSDSRESMKAFQKAKTDGAQLMYLLAGYPYYYSAPGVTGGATLTFNNIKTTGSGYSLSHGVGTSLEVGVEVGKAASSGFKLTFDYDWKKNESEKTTIAFYQTANGIKKENQGAAYYMQIKPIVKKAVQIETFGADKKVIFGKYKLELVFPMITTGAATTAVIKHDFERSNPDKGIAMEEMYGGVSPFSYGLPKLSDSCEIKGTDEKSVFEEIDSIIASQKKSSYQELINLADKGQSEKTGVYHYAKDSNGSLIPAYALNNESGMSYDVLKSTNISNNFAWSASIIQNFSAVGIPGVMVGPYSKFSLTYRGGYGFFSMEEVKDGIKLDVGKRNIQNLPPVTAYFYLFRIDVQDLKDYLGKYADYERPAYIPKWCWDNNVSYIFGLPWFPDNYKLINSNM